MPPAGGNAPPPEPAVKKSSLPYIYEELLP